MQEACFICLVAFGAVMTFAPVFIEMMGKGGCDE